ncbi:hypothetical protein [Bradyrhizobium sp. LMG 9283]|uniref:hypothetical protein n=1 Tax=Bradyrhizobium sp. LMG 9283 TaxID=592064 RepID=UPI00388E7FC0
MLDFFKSEGEGYHARRTKPKRRVMREAVAEPRDPAGREAQHRCGSARPDEGGAAADHDEIGVDQR